MDRIEVLTEEASKAFSNMSTWGTIVAIMEGGSLYESGINRAKQRVIKLAQHEMQKELAIYDRCVELIKQERDK
jgi:hypothetical protein